MYNIPVLPLEAGVPGLERKPGEKGEKVEKPQGSAARTHSLHHERQATANCKVNIRGISLHHLGSHHYDSLHPPLELQNKTLQSYLVRESQKTDYGLNGYKENTEQA